MSSNPFIVEDGSNPVQGTVSRVEQCLSIFQNALYIDTSVDSKEVSFDFDDCCAYVLEGLRGALRDAVNKLDGYEPKVREVSSN